MKLSIFGANLHDQSKGQFEVHRHDCGHCARLRKLGENETVLDYPSQHAVAADLYADMIDEGSMTVSDAMLDVHFAPCLVGLLPHQHEA